MDSGLTSVPVSMPAPSNLPNTNWKKKKAEVKSTFALTTPATSDRDRGAVAIKKATVDCASMSSSSGTSALLASSGSDGEGNSDYRNDRVGPPSQCKRQKKKADEDEREYTKSECNGNWWPSGWMTDDRHQPSLLRFLPPRSSCIMTESTAIE